MTLEELRLSFAGRFDRSPTATVRAPGRVTLVGEHTEGADGFVLPVAIDREVRIALRPRRDTTVRLRALDLDEEITFDAVEPTVRTGFAAYAEGVAWALARDGHTLTGFDGMVTGDVPVGAGLSSSSALALALARAFATAGDLPWDARSMAVTCHRAETDWLGAVSGIVDPIIAACAVEGSALLIDSRDLTTETVPLPPDATLVVLDTGTRRGPVGPAYDDRDEQVAAAAATLGVARLRDVSEAEFERRSDDLDPILRRRARHVIGENARVLRAADAMRRGAAEELGALMNASHASLRDDFLVSAPLLDEMSEIARGRPGCHGARMIGGGFAGCAVALVETRALGDFLPAVEERYWEETGVEASLYPCRASAGAGVLHPRR